MCDSIIQKYEKRVSERTNIREFIYSSFPSTPRGKKYNVRKMPFTAGVGCIIIVFHNRAYRAFRVEVWETNRFGIKIKRLAHWGTIPQPFEHEAYSAFRSLDKRSGYNALLERVNSPPKPKICVPVSHAFHAIEPNPVTTFIDEASDSPLMSSGTYGEMYWMLQDVF